MRREVKYQIVYKNGIIYFTSVLAQWSLSKLVDVDLKLNIPHNHESSAK